MKNRACYPIHQAQPAPLMLLWVVLAASGCGRDSSITASTDRADPAKTGPQTTEQVAGLTIQEHLRTANAAFREGRLASPADDNALGHLLSVIEQDPDNPGAIELLVDLTPMVAAAIESQIAQGDFEQAQPALALLAQASPESLIVATLRRKLTDAEQARAVRSMPTSPAVNPPALTNVSREKTDLPASSLAATSFPTPAPAKVQGFTASPAATATDQVKSASPPNAARIANQGPAVPNRAMAEASRGQDQPPTSTGSTSSRDPVALNKVPPQYPDAAKKRRTEGWVDLRFMVSAAGKVEDIEVLAAEPSGVFERAAERAVQRWTFKPAEQEGIAVPARVRTRVGFRL